ncbi:MAG TPA: hypothetical protein PKA90_13010 [Ignavibacteria bacterium]|nr:hypothetical protein [Ignavibacteria bacterium]HMR41339.1 hypothetical protein [Ignavibacteria bacterium]
MNFNTRLKASLLFAITILGLSALNSFAQDGIKFSEISDATQETADLYINYYFSKEFDMMSEYMHDDFSFQDPTAALIFGGKLQTPKDTALNFFKTNYASILEMKPAYIRKIYSGEQAVYEMNLLWSFNTEKGKISIDMPLVTILSLKDGKVINHRDYGDYTEYVKQFNDQMDKFNK